VLSQSYPHIEYIVIDGASTDDTLKIVRSNEHPNIVLVSEPDLGIYDAMNKGVQIATGDIIGILNSDDVYQDEAVISDVANYFKQDADLDMLYGDLVYVKSDNLFKIVRKWKSKHRYPMFFEHANVPPHPTLFVKRRVYEEAGLYNLKYQLASDYEFMLRIFKKYHFKSIYIARLMVKMRLGGATNKSFRNIFEGNKEIIRAWKSNGFKVPIYLMPLRVIKRLIQFI
jgi:glycosyltransferase involved in cell wall biosynthesis